MDVFGHFPMGRIYSQVPTHMVGRVRRFPFADPRTEPGIMDPSTTTRTTLCMLVQTTINTAVPRGRSVIWDQSTANAVGRIVSALVGTPGVTQVPAGTVDPWLPLGSGVTDDYYFWLVIGGWSWVACDNSAILKGSTLAVVTAGAVGLQTTAPADATAAMVQVNAEIGYAVDANSSVATVDATGGYGTGTGPLIRAVVRTKFSAC